MSISQNATKNEINNFAYLQQEINKKADDIITKNREYKVVMLGEANVGKTSLVKRYIDDEFDKASDSTIGASYRNKKIETSCGTVKLCVWDTAGQERFSTLMPMYYRGANIAYVVFDLSSKPSFDRAKKWVLEVESNHMMNEIDSEIVIALIGNKTDLPVTQTVVNHESAIDYAKTNNIIYATTSAKSADGVKEAFAIPIIYLMERDNIIETIDDEDIVDLDKNSNMNICSGCVPQFISRKKAKPIVLSI